MAKKIPSETSELPPLRVLIVEDSEDDVLLMIHALKKGGYDPLYERVEDAEAMRNALRKKPWDVILCDYQMPRFNGLAAIALLKETGIDIPLIMVSGAIGEETAVACMRLGARDYVMKGNLSRLVPVIERELEEAESRLQHKRTDEALQRSEQKYRLLVESVNEAIVVVQDGRAKFVNRGLEWAGYTREEYLSIPIMETIHPEDRELVEQRYLKKINGDTTATRHIYRGVDKSGRIHWIEVSAVLIDWEGRPATLNLINDITESKQAEEEIIRLREDWESIFQGISHPTVILDPQHGIIAANKAVVCASGLSQTELLGKKCYEVFHGKDTASPSKGCPMENLLASGKAETVTREVEAFGGVFLVSCTPIRNKHGQVEKIIHITTDITDRKRTEEALLESEKRYRQLFDASPDAIMLIGTEGYILNTNITQRRMYRYDSPSDIVGVHVLQLVAPSSRDYAAQVMRRRLNGEDIPAVEYECFRKDGTIFHGEITATILRKTDGTVSGYICIIRDITDRKQSEEQLQQTLESLRKSFAATIQVMVSAVESRDPYTAGHQTRSADLARAIATEMGLPQDTIEGLRMTGSIHDIGKLSIPAEILSKPTKLSELEFSLIKEHARTGYEMLKDVESPWPLAEIVYQHHERMDGSGYPRHLKGEEICMEARIMAVADVVEAMASHRPYRPGLGIDAALNEIKKNRGIFYDEAVADACLKLFREKEFKLEGA
ncbi:MAG: PAS domain S-box protein [Smithellaceae bacterium]|nr:PAS domain S-box protein [Smithellaceae bacterium]